MALLSPEARYSDLKGSLKKYFVDSLVTGESKELYFKYLKDVPLDGNGAKLASWIIINFGEMELGSVASCPIEINLFTRNDLEGDDLAALFDVLMSYIVDENSINGLKTIPFYNTTELPWTLVGGIIPYITRIFEDEEGKDSTKIKTIHITCKWGSK